MATSWKLVVLVAVLSIAYVRAHSLPQHDFDEQVLDSSDGTGTQWESPDGRTRDEWLKTHGQSEEEMRRVMDKLAKLKMEQVGEVPAFDASSINETALMEEDRLDDCIWVTEEQVDQMLEDQRVASEAKAAETEVHHRQKRKIEDFERYMRRKWTSMPIRWKFDGKHNEGEKKIVRGAFQHWMEQTCVLFQEIPTDAQYDQNHILVTKQSTGCHSYVGKVSIIPQQLNLQSSCLWEFGIPVHEVGHALGLWHEQQRNDRDDHIEVLWDNLGSYVGQFYKHTSSVDLGVPYDLGSVMHYSPKAGSKNNKYTMESHDPEYQHNMGQRTGLSFLDAKIINLAYCSHKCANNPLPRPCEREGYQDPKDCSRCICPDGFSGRYCDELQPAYNAQCGGELTATTSPKTIKSPGYDSPGYYENFQQCNWHITAPPNHDVMLKFNEDAFGVYCHSHNRCYHWAELRYKDGLGMQGPRFCCYNAPDTTFRGELGEMMLIFKANYSVRWTTSRRGFQATYYAVPRDDPPTTTTPRTTEPTTTEPVTTTKPPTTTTIATTTSLPTTTPAKTSTTRQTTTSAENECESLDLAFLLDSGGAIMHSNWQHVLNFVTKMVSRFNVGRNHVRVGVASYSNSGTLYFDLDDFYSLESMILSIYTIPSEDQWTNTASGLRVTRTEIFNTSGDRADVQNKLIMVTDGESNREQWQTLEEAEAARESGIEIYAIGIGDEFNFKEAQDITDDAERIIKVDTFSDLTTDMTVEQIKGIVCGTEPTTATGRWEWRCSFEDGAFRSWCGITQDTDDVFNWLIQTGRTPSRKTGPSRAYDGKYYIYIEASKPRKKNDDAVVTLPDLGQTGTHCVSFYYHMYGFHINTLQLLKKNGGNTEEVWKRSGEQGNFWLYEAVEVELNEGDQLAFRAVRGGEYSGDISLDSLHIYSGDCNTPSGDAVRVAESSPSSAGGATSLLTLVALPFAVVMKQLMFSSH